MPERTDVVVGLAVGDDGLDRGLFRSAAEAKRGLAPPGRWGKGLLAHLFFFTQNRQKKGQYGERVCMEGELEIV